MELNEVLERVEPFDECVPKSKFLEVMRNYPELKKSLNDQLSLDNNQVWIEKAENGKFFFSIYDDRYIASKGSMFPNSIKLKFIGMQSVPVISIDIHKWPA